MTDDKVNRDWNYDIHQAVWPLFKFRGPLSFTGPGEFHDPEECADIICDAIKDIVADLEFRLSWWEENYGQGVYAPSKEFNDRVMDALDAIPPQTILLPDDGQPSEPRGPFVVTDWKDVTIPYESDDKPYDTAKVLGSFDTEDDAAAYIGTLPEHLTGRYSIDGPSDDDDGRDPDKYRTRTDPDAAFAAFMSMPEDEWLGLLLSLAGGGVLEPAEQQGLARALVERGER